MVNLCGFSFHLCLITLLIVVWASLNCDLVSADAERKVYIVYMGAISKAKAEYSKESVHLQMLEQVLDGSSPRESLVRSYGKSFDGFAAKLTEQEQRKLRGMNNVVSVFPSRTARLQTTRSWDFLGFPSTVRRMPTIESDVIIGMIDSGIWPESESFSPVEIGPPPSKWKGICQNITCNNKIIGARFYNAENRYAEGDEKSPRDTEGHGSHTASTVAGVDVKNTSLYGIAEGTVRGAVPSARIAVYKPCWKLSCASHDVLAAFDDAIEDGVDIISISASPTKAIAFTKDPIAIGAFHAMEKGILTSTAAGNAGFVLPSVNNVAPWLLTVGATNTDRQIISNVTIGNHITMVGHAINTFETQKREVPIVYAHDHPAHNSSKEEASVCFAGSLDKDSVKGKIVFCDMIFDAAGAVLAGAQGALCAADVVNAYSYPLPATVISLADFKKLSLYMNTTRNPMARIFKSQAIHNSEAPRVAAFSSKGPNTISPNILKPDLCAPGVEILAASSPKAPISFYEGDKRSVMYKIISGTSMACPHASGAAAYVKTFHPSWSPAAIKSALMTTAYPINSSYHPEAELAYGAGQIDPLKAVNPGLVYDTLKPDYIQALCNLGYSPDKLKVLAGENVTCAKENGTDALLNYPSMGATVTVGKPIDLYFPRTVTNVGSPNCTYRAILGPQKLQNVTVSPNVLSATVGPQKLLNVTVNPNVLSFKSLNEKQLFTVHVDGAGIPKDSIISTWLLWTDGIHNVRSPIAVWADGINTKSM